MPETAERRDPIEAAFYATPPELRRPEKRQEPRAIVPAWWVVPPLRELAAGTLCRAYELLELAPLQLNWMAPPELACGAKQHVAAPAGREAFTSPVDESTAVYLSVFATTPVLTILHEVRHLWQWSAGWYPAGQQCADPTCSHVGYTLTADEEDRFELDACRWSIVAQREHRIREYPLQAPRGLI